MPRPRRGGGCGGGGGCENLSCTYKLWRVNISQFECYIWVSRFRRGYSLTSSDNDKPLAKRKPHWLQLALLWQNACATLQWQLRCLPAETANAAFWRPTDGDNPKSLPRYEKASRFVNALIDVESQNYRCKKGMIRDVWMQFIDGCVDSTSLTKRWCFVRKKTHAVTAMLGEAVKCTHAFPTYRRVVV